MIQYQSFASGSSLMTENGVSTIHSVEERCACNDAVLENEGVCPVEGL